MQIIIKYSPIARLTFQVYREDNSMFIVLNIWFLFSIEMLH